MLCGIWGGTVQSSNMSLVVHLEAIASPRFGTPTVLTCLSIVPLAMHMVLLRSSQRPAAGSFVIGLVLGCFASIPTKFEVSLGARSFELTSF